MNNIYTISKKLNYSTETQTTKSKVDHIISIIKSKMDSLGFEYREYSSFNCKNTEYQNDVRNRFFHISVCFSFLLHFNVYENIYFTVVNL